MGKLVNRTVVEEYVDPDEAEDESADLDEAEAEDDEHDEEVEEPTASKRRRR